MVLLVVIAVFAVFAGIYFAVKREENLQSRQRRALRK
jgi:hypothetical protein